MDTANLLGLVNHQAETTVLSAMRLNTGAAIELAQLLEPTDFYDPRRRVLFEAMRQVLLGIEPIDDNAIMDAIRRIQREQKKPVHIEPDYLAHFADGDMQRAVSYAHSVKRLAWLRGAGEFAHWLVEELQAKPDPDDLFTAAQERWQLLQPTDAESRFVYGWDTLKMHGDMLRERIRERNEGTTRMFDWPWSSWTTDGRVRPLRPGMLGIIAAPDGAGKTTYMECIAEHWARRGNHVVYVHLEDELGYKLDRRAARNASVALDRIEDGDLTTDETTRLREAHRSMGAWADHLHYLDAAGDSMTSIVRELEARVAEGVCDCVVFDYLDKVQPSRGQATFFGGNAWERQANDMEQLKVFAERCKVPVLTATQGNKTMQQQGQTQTRQAIQGSGQKSHKAQLVIILTRDLVGPDGLRDRNGAIIAEAGEYSPLVNVRIDKQNRGRTSAFQQFLVGRFFDVRDIQQSSAGK